MKHERRDRVGEIRAVDDTDGKRTITLHCIRPGVVDDYGSLWSPDTFDDALKVRLPTLCWAHDWSDPLGRGVDYRVSSDGPEVIFEFDDFEDVPSARRAYAQVRSGTITDCSVGFSNTQRRDPTDAEKAQYPGVREVIEKADLDEVSLVLAGAVPGAKVLAVRSGGQVDIEAVLAIAKRKVDGTISHEEAIAAIDLLATDDALPPEEPPVEEPPAPEEPEPEADEMDAEIEAALAVVTDRSRR